MIDEDLLYTIILGKGLVFVLVVVSCAAVHAAQAARDDGGGGGGGGRSRRPTPSLAVDEEASDFQQAIRTSVSWNSDVRGGAGGEGAATTALEAAAEEETATLPPSQGAPQSWMSRAGLYAIFATQSNDFALGLPIVQAIWGNTMSPCAPRPPALSAPRPSPPPVESS